MTTPGESRIIREGTYQGRGWECTLADGTRFAAIVNKATEPFQVRIWRPMEGDYSGTGDTLTRALDAAIYQSGYPGLYAHVLAALETWLLA
jgi:hypothetical protein